MRLRIASLAVVAALIAAGCSGDDGVETTAPTTGPSPSTTDATTTTTTIPIRDELSETVTLDFDGVERRYDLYVPGGFPDVATALVIDMHGALGTPAMQDQLSAMRTKADEEGFVVAQPAGLLRTWDIITGNGNDVEFLKAVVDDVGERTKIDPDRVYATGMSNGGGMADRLACLAGDVFAAVAGVAGWYTDVVDCDASTTPVLAFHGTADLVVPYDGTGPFFIPVDEWAATWAERNGCDPEPMQFRVSEDVRTLTWSGCAADVQLYTIEGGGHGWPGSDVSLLALSSTDTINATNLIWEFFEKHPLTG